MALTRPPLRVPLIPITLRKDAVGADNANAARQKVPFKCKVAAVYCGVDNPGGGTPFTDVDIQVKKKPSGAAVDLLSARAAAVDSSTAVAGGVQGTLTSTEADLIIAADDHLLLDVDVTGGASTPVADCWAVVWVTPLI